MRVFARQRGEIGRPGNDGQGRSAGERSIPASTRNPTGGWGRSSDLAVSMRLVLGSARASRAANGAPPLVLSPTGGSLFGAPSGPGSIRGGAPRITREGACAPQFQLNRYGLGIRDNQKARVRGSGQKLPTRSAARRFGPFPDPRLIGHGGVRLGRPLYSRTVAPNLCCRCATSFSCAALTSASVNVRSAWR